MQAVVYEGPGKIVVKGMPDPKVQEPTDAVARMTTSAICGSDLHMYDGHIPTKPGMVLGHEPRGVVEKVGDGVKLTKEGDWVVMPFNIACGTCYNCIRGYTSACQTMNPDGAGAAYANAEMGPHPSFSYLDQ